MSVYDPARSDGHELARLQIDKHGKDRYPDLLSQCKKLIDEAGELLVAIVVHTHDESHWDHLASECHLIRSESADVGLSLFALCNKSGVDLMAVMADLVMKDDRRFGDG